MEGIVGKTSSNQRLESIVFVEVVGVDSNQMGKCCDAVQIINCNIIQVKNRGNMTSDKFVGHTSKHGTDTNDGEITNHFIVKSRNSNVFVIGNIAHLNDGINTNVKRGTLKNIVRVKSKSGDVIIIVIGNVFAFKLWDHNQQCC